jgi:solute carrier family 12 sodium/potassium/chloride transporter 2
MNTIGFCDSLNELLKEHGLKIIDNGVQDVRIIGVVAILVMIFICAIGMEWESKVRDASKTQFLYTAWKIRWIFQTL